MFVLDSPKSHSVTVDTIELGPGHHQAGSLHHLAVQPMDGVHINAGGARELLTIYSRSHVW